MSISPRSHDNWCVFLFLKYRFQVIGEQCGVRCVIRSTIHVGAENETRICRDGVLFDLIPVYRGAGLWFANRRSVPNVLINGVLVFDRVRLYDGDVIQIPGQYLMNSGFLLKNKILYLNHFLFDF